MSDSERDPTTEASPPTITMTSGEFRILADGRVVVCAVDLQRALRRRSEAGEERSGAARERVPS